MDFRDHSISELVKRVKNKEISAKELTESALSNIEKFDASINAFCALNSEDAIKQAEALDKKISDGEDVGLLAGIPIGVKDLEDAKGFVTSYGSELHINDNPSKKTKKSRLCCFGKN
jgi:aspartyl-tRNA(Asn)/glutamyl-tRNA(Gln) amidotransferase subunit A